MTEPEKSLTEAEKQIRRLESLRRQSQETSKASVEKAYFPPKTLADRTEAKLKSLREQAQRPVGSPKRRPKIEGKQKSSKLPFVQIRVLEQLFEADKRLRGSVVTRIALNRLLGLDNSSEETDLESRLNEILRQFKNKA